MKIVRDIPQQLIIEDVPWFWSVVLGGMLLILAFAGIGTLMSGEWGDAAIIGLFFVFVLGFLAMVAVRTMMIFDAIAGTVEIRTRTLRGYSRRHFELRYLDSAKIQTSQSDDTTTHRVALVLADGMDAGTHPVTEVYTSGKGAERAANAINTWLARHLDSEPAPH